MLPSCAGVLLPSICLWLVSIFWLYIWKFQLFFHFMYFLRISYIFLLYFPPTPRFFSTSLPSGLPSYSFSALWKPQTPKKKQTKRKQNILENGLCWPAIVQGTFSGLWLLFSVLPRWKKTFSLSEQLPIRNSLVVREEASSPPFSLDLGCFPSWSWCRYCHHRCELIGASALLCLEYAISLESPLALTVLPPHLPHTSLGLEKRGSFVQQALS